MLAPPATFAQLRALTWSAPTIVTGTIGAALWGVGLRPGCLVAPLALGAGATAWALAMLAVWVSRFGVRHTLVAVASGFFGACIPLSVTLSSVLVTPDVPGWAPALVIVGVQALLLMLSAVVHARRAPTGEGARRLHWPGCDIDMKHFTWSRPEAPLPSSARCAPPAIGAALSVVAYQALRTRLPGDDLAVVGLLIGNALSAWLCLGPLGRALGRSWRLAAVERAEGRRFVYSRLDWLTRERLRSPIGHWLAARFR
jgi:hypothetical protein